MPAPQRVERLCGSYSKQTSEETRKSTEPIPPRVRRIEPDESSRRAMAEAFKAPSPKTSREGIPTKGVPGSEITSPP